MNATFKQPIVTPKVRLESRKALIVELKMNNNESYFGECNAFETDWYAPTTIADVEADIRAWLEDVSGKSFYTYEEALTLANRLETTDARHTVVMAFYTMFHALEDITVDYGATVSGLTEERLLKLQETQPQRIKLKWTPNVLEDVQRLQNLAHQPEIALDANESLSEQDIATALKLKKQHILYIEEPFKTLKAEELDEINQAMPIAIDEKATDLDRIKALVRNHPIYVVVVKPFRLGGIDRAMEIIRWLSDHHIQTVIGGMYEYGLSRYFTALLAQYASLPSDITPSGYYFDTDCVPDSGRLEDGQLKFSKPVVDKQVLERAR
ncbi:o-succinylbenzoate synthase [Staphylococcus argensis]|nr:o-succinylbenzoate synthase [Staphylococcus argensis]MCY6990781.1 o-succinylbenzoate synthase [Staphylococcus argensis]